MNAIGTVPGAQQRVNLTYFVLFDWSQKLIMENRIVCRREYPIKIVTIYFVMSSSALFVWSVGDNKLVYPQYRRKSAIWILRICLTPRSPLQIV